MDVGICSSFINEFLFIVYSFSYSSRPSLVDRQRSGDRLMNNHRLIHHEPLPSSSDAIEN